MGVGDDQRAQDGVHDGVEGAGGERSDGERDEADGDQSVGVVSWRFLGVSFPAISEGSEG